MRDDVYPTAWATLAELSDIYGQAEKYCLAHYGFLGEFKSAFDAGLDKNLPYVDMRLRLSSYQALLARMKQDTASAFETEDVDGGLMINKYTGTTKDVVIPDTIGGKQVMKIRDYAFDENKLTSVVIPNSVTSIGAYAFHKNQLTSVVISKSVTSIGTGAFSQNQLTSVVIPNSVTSIGEFAFSCNKLTSITIGNGVTSIRDDAFAGNQLTSVVIPGSITYIGNSAFEWNPLTSVTIGSGVTIGNILTFNPRDENSTCNFQSDYEFANKKAGTYIRTKSFRIRYDGKQIYEWKLQGELVETAPPVTQQKESATASVFAGILGFIKKA